MQPLAAQLARPLPSSRAPPSLLRAGVQPVYTCTVYNPGATLTPVSYKLRLSYEFNQTSLNAKERAVAKKLFDKCAGECGCMRGQQPRGLACKRSARVWLHARQDAPRAAVAGSGRCALPGVLEGPPGKRHRWSHWLRLCLGGLPPPRPP